MSKKNASVQIIPVDKINILNPRIRNKKVFDAIVHNITAVGLKRPITVTPCRSGAAGKEYDLVCGQGRLEAFIACGQKTIPAMVIDASEEQALIMSLVENLARRKRRPIELLQGVEILRKQGYDPKTIAAKTGMSPDYIGGIVKLLEHGEDRLVSAVEAGHIPITLAVSIVSSPRHEQEALQAAYENGHLSGQKLLIAKRVLETRARCGKNLAHRRHRKQARPEDLTARQVLNAYRQEVERKTLLARRAEIASSHLLFLIEALRQLKRDDHFMTLLRAEQLSTMPRQLAEMVDGKE